MDMDALKRHLERLQTGQLPANAPLVEHYLDDPHAQAIGQHFLKFGRSPRQRPLLPPSHCLLILD